MSVLYKQVVETEIIGDILIQREIRIRMVPMQSRASLKAETCIVTVPWAKGQREVFDVNKQDKQNVLKHCTKPMTVHF